MTLRSSAYENPLTSFVHFYVTAKPMQNVEKDK